MPVDELGDRALTQTADLPQCGDVRAEYPCLAQHPERRRRRTRAATDRLFDVEDLQHVADGDVGRRAALGGDDHRAPNHDVAQSVTPDRRILLAQATQPLEPAAVAAVDHVADQPAFLPAGQQPFQRGPHHVRADEHQQRAGHPIQPALGVLAMAAQPLLRPPRPALTGGVGAAGQPALLPRIAWLVGEPVQQQRQSPATRLPHPMRRRQRRRRRRDDPIQLVTIDTCDRPLRRCRTGGVALSPIRMRRLRSHRGGNICIGLRITCGLDKDAHIVLRPNSTSRVSAR
jgi:hypothetical protein